jgi:hypothetical protein
MQLLFLFHFLVTTPCIIVMIGGGIIGIDDSLKPSVFKCHRNYASDISCEITSAGNLRSKKTEVLHVLGAKNELVDTGLSNTSYLALTTLQGKELLNAGFYQEEVDQINIFISDVSKKSIVIEKKSWPYMLYRGFFAALSIFLIVSALMALPDLISTYKEILSEKDNLT